MTDDTKSAAGEAARDTLKEPTIDELVHGCGVLSFTESDGPRRDYLFAVHQLAIEALNGRADLQRLSAERDTLKAQNGDLIDGVVDAERERDEAREFTREFRQLRPHENTCLCHRCQKIASWPRVPQRTE